MFDRKDFSDRYYYNWKPMINIYEIEKNNELLLIITKSVSQN